MTDEELEAIEEMEVLEALEEAEAMDLADAEYAEIVFAVKWGIL
jgi:hypothetical protein